MQAPGPYTHLLNQLLGEGIGNDNSDACHDPVVTLTHCWPTAPSVSPLRLVMSQQNPSPPSDQKETITLPALIGKCKEMNAFNTRFLGKISAINIFQDFKALREEETSKLFLPEINATLKS